MSSLKKNQYIPVDANAVIVNGLYLFYHGPLSNWYMEDFVYDGVTYNCGEQLMMATKAKLFKDEAMLAEIMACTTPRKQKSLGRLVANFDAEVWMKHSEDLLFPGLLAKFTTSPTCQQAILSTQDLLIVEASPYDQVWGIGLSKDAAEARDRKKWKGLNKLGNLLTKIRDQLKVNLDVAKITCGQTNKLAELCKEEHKQICDEKQELVEEKEPVITLAQHKKARKGPSLAEAIAAKQKKKQLAKS